MRKSVLVSIIIPCYNSSWSLPNLAANIAAIELEDIEVVFIDDGSTDGSAQIMQRLLPETVIVTQLNAGPSNARNKGLAIAQGDFIQFLDADDTIEPGKLLAQTTQMQQEYLDVICSDWRVIFVNNDKSTYGPVVHAQYPSGDIVESLLGGWWAPPHAYLFRKQACLLVGGFDETVQHAAEDFDFILRIAMTGVRFGYLPKCYANYCRYQNERPGRSQRDNFEFWQGMIQIIDCAIETLMQRGDFTLQRRQAAARQLFHIGQNVSDLDWPYFEELLTRVKEIDPNFHPPSSLLYQSVAGVFGTRRAERIAIFKRQFLKDIHRLH